MDDFHFTAYGTFSFFLLLLEVDEKGKEIFCIHLSGEEEIVHCFFQLHPHISSANCDTL